MLKNTLLSFFENQKRKQNPHCISGNIWGRESWLPPPTLLPSSFFLPFLPPLQRSYLPFHRSYMLLWRSKLCPKVPLAPSPSLVPRFELHIVVHCLGSANFLKHLDLNFQNQICKFQEATPTKAPFHWNLGSLLFQTPLVVPSSNHYAPESKSYSLANVLYAPMCGAPCATCAAFLCSSTLPPALSGVP
jgi:hypothetical protein